MAKIRKIYDQAIKPDGSKLTIYPITSTRAVYTPESITMEALINEGYRFGGVIEHLEDSPEFTDQRVFYLADKVGVYPNFGNLTLAGGELGVFCYNKSQWIKGILKGGGTNLTGYQVVTSASLLPDEESTIGYIIGTDLYVWVGEGGDTKEGKYKNVGPFVGPQGNGIESVAIDPPDYKLVIQFTDGTSWESEDPVINLPNEDDLIIDSNKKLKFNDRPTTYGKGYKILRRGSTFAEQVTAENTIYEIRYDFNLDGNCTIPDNCTLKFNGGSIGGAYSLTGQNTKIQASKNVIFNGVGIAGTWNVPCIYSAWFANITNNNEIKKLFALTNEAVENTVIIEPGNYSISVSAENQTVIRLNSNTNVIINGTITLGANGYDAYKIFQIAECSNVTMSGSGSIVGDKDTHTGTTGEYGHGVYVGGSKNIYIKDLTFTKCWGDGIYVGPGGTNSSIRIEGCEIYNCRRQGITLADSILVEIVNCYIHDISGHNPQSCIDIEPNSDSTQHVDICTISNCKLVNTTDCIRVTGLTATNCGSSITVDSCYIESATGYAVYVNNIGENVNINNNILKGAVYNHEREPDRNNPRISYSNNIITTNALTNQYARFINNKITTIGDGIKRGIFRDNFIIINLESTMKICFKYAPVLINNRIQVVYTDDNYEAFFEISSNQILAGEFEGNTIMFPTDSQELLCSKFTDGVADWIKRNIKDVMLRSRNISNCTLYHVDENIKLSTKSNLPVVTGSTNRTYNPVIGEKLFDATAGKEIIYKGSYWVDALGNLVS